MNNNALHPSAPDAPDLKWFTDARFGMFVHWGIYAIPGGTWNGMDTPWVSEWVMSKMQIPIREYETLAARFNPTCFDAEAWAGIARDAGMKYMVVTAKHHDGFAMFHSRYDRYNIVDATPYRADPLAALARACRQAGVRLGFYYSQDMDWHEKGATGNTWDFGAGEKTPEAFDAYLQGKVRTQLRELLTHYGDVAVIWFDTTMRMSQSQCLSLKEFVHSIQPSCLVSGRLGNGLGDYGTLGDYGHNNRLDQATACRM